MCCEVLSACVLYVRALCAVGMVALPLSHHPHDSMGGA